MDKIRVMIADDQTLFRQGLRLLLSVQPDIQVVAEAANGLEVLRLITEHQPHVILMDIEMPGLDGVATTRAVRQQYPQCHIVILTTFDNEDYIFEGLRAGALGYLLKDAPSDKLIDAIRIASRGESFLQPAIATKLVSEFNRLSNIVTQQKLSLENPLTPREVEILRLLTYGMTNAEIAQRLVITEGTVKNHVTAILSKLGVDDRSQAVQRSKTLGLI
jgi:DNA-binding NarL/FixJ family response regulator